ncbi:MAG: hypothetical protein FJX57_10725 [Alphaproteobacteria bacterium]|nr:hypothetical protein [Alphaproteobacteria bacterium]
MRRAARLAAIALGLCASAPAPALAQSDAPQVVPLHWPGEFHVATIDGDCVQTIVIPALYERAILERFNIAYRRADGCRWTPYHREVAGLRAALEVLLADLPDRNRLAGFYFGRITQPELRLRFANAGLKHGLAITGEPPGYNRQLRIALDAEDAFRELREVLQALGFSLRLRSLEKVERVRVVGLAELAVSHEDLVVPPPDEALLPVAALVWFDLALP